MQGPEKQKKQQTSQCVSFINPTDELMNSQNPSARGKRRLAATTQPSKSVLHISILTLILHTHGFSTPYKKMDTKKCPKAKNMQVLLK